MNLVLLAVGAGSLLASSVMLVALSRPRNAAETWMGAFLIGWAQVNIAIQAMSILGTITPWSIASVHVVMLLGAALACTLSKPARPPLPGWRAAVDLWRSVALPLPVKFLLVVWAAAVLLGTLYVCVMAPQSDGDVLAYHLGRAAHWLQNQSIAHYATELVRQNEMPLNAEMGLFWTLVFVRGEELSGLPAWLCWGPLSIACFGILRGVGLSFTVSALAVCTLASMPQVIYLSSSAENDLTAATLLVVGMYFLSESLKCDEIWLGRAILAALGIGLALATKGTTLLWGPSVVLLMTVYVAARRVPRWKMRCIALAVASAACSAAFAGYGWIENWRMFGSPFLSKEETARQRIVDANFATWASNCLKNWAWFCEPMQVGERVFGTGRLQRWTTDVLNRAHAPLGIDPASPRTTFGHPAEAVYEIPVTPRSQWMGHLGPVGFLWFWPAAIATMIAGVVRLFRGRRFESTTTWSMIWTSTALIHFAVLNALITWRPGSGRLWVPFVCAALPAIAWVFQQAARTRVTHWATALFVGVLALGSSMEAVLSNPRAPLAATATRTSILGRSRSELQRDMMIRERRLFSSLMVNSFVPKDARLGLALGQYALDFLMFGPDLTRTCIPIIRADLRDEDLASALTSRKLDALLLDRGGQPEGQRPVITRRLEADGTTIFEWRGGLLAVKSPLSGEGFPWRIRDK